MISPSHHPIAGVTMSSILASSDTSGGGAIVFLVLAFAALILVIAGWWKMFEKAGEAGWKAIIPIYNLIILLKIAGRPVWWILLLLIPCVGVVIMIIMYSDLSKSFGKGAGFTVGLVFLQPIFVLILGFGDAKYLGPAGPEGAGAMGGTGGTLPPPTA